MKYSITLFRIRGISIELHYTFIGFLGLLFILTYPVIYPAVLVGILYFSVIIHELAHSFMAQRYDLSVKKIVLYPIGGAAQIEDIPENPRIEALVAIIGPISSIFIGIVALGLHLVLPLSFSTISLFVGTGFVFLDVGVLNIFVALFNLIPAFPMDGGRVLRASLTHFRKDFVLATENAIAIGKFFALLMILYGFLASFWFTIIGFFLYFGASQEIYSARISSILRPLRVGDIMLGSESVLTVSPNMLLSEAIDLMFQAQIQDLIVCTESKYLGVIAWGELLKVQPQLRLITRVGDLRINPLSIMSDSSVLDAYKVMVKERTKLIPVINTDYPYDLMGVITNQSIAYNLETAKIWGFSPQRSS